MSQHLTLCEKAGKLGWWLVKDFFQALEFLGETAITVWDAISHPKKIRFRDVWKYMNACGADALPIATLICLSMGIILGFQGALQLEQYGGEIYLATAVSISIVMELGPLMIAIISIGRSGSAFAAEIGTMKAAEEIDAMITMGLLPGRFLVIPKLIAMILVAPLLNVYGCLAGIIGGLLVGHWQCEIPITTYLQMSFDSLTIFYISQGLIKSLCFAIIITIIGCMRGFESNRDAQGVGQAATSAVVTSIFLIIVADTLLTVLFSRF